MTPNRTIAVFGAYGHTGRFVISELRKRGWTAILSGRDAGKLNRLRETYAGLDIRAASIDSPASLDRALEGAAAVINCAGPFVDTAPPLIEAALRAGIHYLDVTAEQQAAVAAFERFDVPARGAGIVVVPAMGFFGGLGDLLASAAMGGWAEADEIAVAYALDSWRPTLGTRLTGQRNTGPRFVLSKNKLEVLADPSRHSWTFPAPFGVQEVTGLCLAEIITISRHLVAPEVHASMNLAPLEDIHDPATPAPIAADESGRSSQIFLVEVRVRRGLDERHAWARGRDIYAITAPIVVEAAQRAVTGFTKRYGVAAAGDAFDARDVLDALCPAHLSLDLGR
jgi:NAD(P)-dependent dehydrogenase (short-subunit alcohol dehydrogenase family)